MSEPTIEQRYSWKPFLCSYDTPEGKFSLTVHAISWEHAELQVQSIRESLTLDGEISAIIDGDKS